jgi:hypothetical protein
MNNGLPDALNNEVADLLLVVKKNGDSIESQTLLSPGWIRRIQRSTPVKLFYALLTPKCFVGPV